MKKHLLPKREKYYKAAMHVHTTVSDGKKTPEETKDAYKALGYSIVAYTDHDVMVPHNELADDDFLPLTAVELARNSKELKEIGFSAAKTVHMNIYSCDKNAVTFPGFCEEAVIFPASRGYVTDEMRRGQDENTTYSTEYINSVIARANQSGFLVSLNHPVWSLQNYNEYINYEGLFGVEVYNSSCVLMGFDDTEQPLYDFLDKCENVRPMVGDDWHGGEKEIGKSCVWIGAEALEYDKVFDALRNGDFYSSTGPEIYELSIDDGILKIRCSEAVKIVLSTERRRIKAARSDGGEPITSCEFDISDLLSEHRMVEGKYADLGINKKTYIRLTVKDKNGDKAYTHAYYLDEL
jgi:hypothetical protein